MISHLATFSGLSACVFCKREFTQTVRILWYGKAPAEVSVVNETKNMVSFVFCKANSKQNVTHALKRTHKNN